MACTLPISKSVNIQWVVIEIVAGFLPINVIAADSCPNAGNDSKVPGLASGVEGEPYSLRYLIWL